MRKSVVKFLTITAVLLMVVWVASCACKYPQEEMDAARASIADAKAADAPKYAPDEYKSAEDMLAKGEGEANENDCDAAKASAIEAIRLANIAKELSIARNVPPPPVMAEPEPVLMALELATVYFDFDEYAIRADQRATLNSNGNQLLANTASTILIEGHCDERGTVEYNITLGQKRADAVKTYLKGMGVDGGRLKTLSYGEERPAANGTGEDVWAQNRRAKFVTE